MNDNERMHHHFVSGAAGLQYFRGFRVGRSESESNMPLTPMSHKTANHGWTALSMVALFLILGAYGCTTQRDGRFYRAYHNTTSRFNGFHFARLAMEEADQKLAETNEENWDEVITLFLYGTEDQADFLYPLMERAVEKCSRVVDRHAMTPPKRQQKDFQRPQLNREIDDSYRICEEGRL